VPSGVAGRAEHLISEVCKGALIRLHPVSTQKLDGIRDESQTVVLGSGYYSHSPLPPDSGRVA
jgi:hypothetical protein